MRCGDKISKSVQILTSLYVNWIFLTINVYFRKIIWVNICKIALISHISKVMLKILKARLQQYLNQEIPDVQAGFRRGRGTRDQTDPRQSKRIPEKHLLLLHCAKASAYMDHKKLWKILKEMGIPDHFNCLLGNLYAGQEATVRAGRNNRRVPNRERSISRLYIVTLFI